MAVEKITQKEVELRKFRIYPEVYFNGDINQIDVATYVRLYRNNKVYLGFIRKQIDLSAFPNIENITRFFESFENDAYIMAANGKINEESENILFYELEDYAKDTGDI